MVGRSHIILLHPITSLAVHDMIDAMTHKLTKTPRLLQALALKGHQNINPLLCWTAFIPLAILYSYLLSPLFVYYVRGVPPKEALEVFDGTWRQEGEVRSGKSRLLAPLYFIDNESGSRQVHCGFITQLSLCGFPFAPRLTTGDKVRVHFNDSFGVLAYEFLSSTNRAGMSYDTGVYMYATPKMLIRHNRGAHILLPLLILVYAFLVLMCWQELKEKFCDSADSDKTAPSN